MVSIYTCYDQVKRIGSSMMPLKPTVFRITRMRLLTHKSRMASFELRSNCVAPCSHFSGFGHRTPHGSRTRRGTQHTGHGYQSHSSLMYRKWCNATHGSASVHEYNDDAGNGVSGSFSLPKTSKSAMIGHQKRNVSGSTDVSLSSMAQRSLFLEGLGGNRNSVMMEPKLY